MSKARSPLSGGWLAKNITASNDYGEKSLYNRRYLRDMLAHEILRAKRKAENLSIIVVDADHFKHINDTYGHLMGDRVLIQVSHMIESKMRESDIVCRYGDEEFLMVLSGATLESAQKRAEEIIIKADKAMYQSKANGRNRVTVSARILTYCTPTPSKFTGFFVGLPL